MPALRQEGWHADRIAVKEEFVFKLVDWNDDIFKFQ